MKNQFTNIDLLIQREEIYNDFIQEYNDLTQDEISDLVDKEMEKYE
jgi:predicted XRE-type DNA-binding protein